MLKSIFIVAYIVVAVVLLHRGISALLDSTPSLAPIGLLLTTLPMLLFLTSIMVFKHRARTSQNMPIILSLALIGSGISLYVWMGQNPSSHTPLPTLAATALLFVYVFWYSRLDRAGSKIEIGKKLPDFTLSGSYGEPVNSADFTGSPLVLVFYRGNWCPLCMAQVKEMAAGYNRLKRIGARVVFASPQPDSNTKALAKKFGTDGLEFMQDKDNHAAKALGIVSKSGLPVGLQAMGYDSDTVLPTVIICDKDGTVIWAHETDNYRVRPEPETYLAVLKGSTASAKTA